MSPSRSPVQRHSSEGRYKIDIQHRNGDVDGLLLHVGRVKNLECIRLE